MVQIIVIALCAFLINQFDTSMPNNQQYPEVFLIWVATRIFAVGIITTLITGIFDSRGDSQGLKVKWYARPFKFIYYSMAVVICTIVAQFIDVRWFSHWWSFPCLLVPFVALMAVFLAALTVFDSTDELSSWQ